MTSSSVVSASPIDLPGGVRFYQGTITLDTNYATGGIALTPAQLGDSSRLPDFVLCDGSYVGGPPGTSQVPVAWNKATSKMTVYGTAITDDTGITEEAAETIETVIVHFLSVYINAGQSFNTVVA